VAERPGELDGVFSAIPEGAEGVGVGVGVESLFLASRARFAEGRSPKITGVHEVRRNAEKQTNTSQERSLEKNGPICFFGLFLENNSRIPPQIIIMRIGRIL
jgi:hypothetical protein